MQRKTVPQTSGCQQVSPMVDSRVCRTSSDTDEVECSHRPASVSAGRHSLSHR